jgi:hypothetical protein
MVRDVEFLHALMMDQNDRIIEMGLQDVAYLENQVCFITYNMMVNGFGVDERGWMEYTEAEEKVYNACLEKLNKIAPINWNSWQQYCKFFGVSRTEDLDAIHSPDDFNKIIIEDDLPEGNTKINNRRFAALTLWREAREHFKNVNTYGKSWLAQHMHKGLVNCNYNQMVNTARYSCSNPNLQNVPSDTPHRAFMIPGHGKNNVFVIADFSGQEMCIIAYLSGEESWMQCLRDGKDIHGMVAADILAAEWTKLNDSEKAQQRKIIKIINFSIAYGAGIETIAQRAGTTTVIISSRLGAMKRRYPKVFRMLETNGADAKRTWESRSLPPFNRYRSLAMETEGWRRVNIGKNNKIQATAADMSKLSMYYFQLEIDKGLPALFIHMLHDELIVECKASDSKRVAKKLQAAMDAGCTAILGEPLSAPELKIQRNWDKRKEG